MREQTTGGSQTKNLADVAIADLWRALGGGEIRRGRCRAFWRNGDGWNVALELERGIWHDKVTHEGGGVLALVQTALNCSKHEALRWLERESFIEPRRPLSAAEKREWATRKRAAEAEALNLVEWRRRLLAALRWARNCHFSAYHRAMRYIWVHSLDSPLGGVAADVADVCERHYQRLDAAIDKLQVARFDVLLNVCRNRRRAA